MEISFRLLYRVQLIDELFKLLPLDLQAVAVLQHPAGV